MMRAILEGTAIGLGSVSLLVLAVWAMLFPWGRAAAIVILIALAMLIALYALVRFIVWTARDDQRA